ncbi:MAG: DUF4091 domain-containing protein [Sedimentisphaerales bacterium]|nr:DUF4091 domain-containing protein [Sedimentisphaerales bacterium]
MVKQALKISLVLCLTVCLWSGSLLAATPPSYYTNSLSTLRAQAQTYLTSVGRGSQTYAVGIAPPMTRIYYEGGPDLAWTGPIEITAARGESEYRELAIIPMVVSGNVANVSVSVSEMACTSPAHVLHPTNEVKVGPLGYVTAEARVAEAEHYVPDIMLYSGVSPFLAYRDRLQAVFIQFEIAEDTPAGLYTGQVTIAPDGLYAEVFDIELTVLDFVLPYGGAIPAQFSSTQGDMMRDYRCVSGWWDPPIPDKNSDGAIGFYELASLNQTDINMMTQSVEDYFATPGNNYMIIRTPGTWQSGNLVGGFGGDYATYTTTEIDAMKNYWDIMADILDGCGHLDDAVVYVWDEPTSAVLTEVQTRCQWVHDADSRLRTQVVDNSGNCRSLRQSGYINYHIILTSQLDLTADAPANWAAGTEVGIYVCIEPLGSYPNFMADDTLLDARVLGWQMAQRGLTGFLYWETQQSFWEEKNDQRFPRTECGSMSNYGDGTLIHAPNGGLWCVSPRLHNFADGMEDYIYIQILEELMDRSDPANPGIPDTTEWQTARSAGAAALAQVAGVGGTSMSGQTTSTTTLLDARSDIADAIVTLNTLLGPEVCGEEGQHYYLADISGPQGQPDCQVDMYDFGQLVEEWAGCTDPCDPCCGSNVWSGTEPYVP